MEEDTVVKRPGKLRGDLIKRFSFKNEGDPPSPAGIVRQASKQKKEFQKYDSLKIFHEPVQLISVDETKRLRFNDAAIAELQKVDHDVNVVAVAGLYRTGKSLLLNRLAGLNNAFDIGHTNNAKTLGIWIMCLPHPTQESQVLVLLDTEGLGAVQEDKLLEDRWHFLLATLLSSTLVYNIRGNLDADAIQKLCFLKDIKSSLSIMASDTEDDSYFDVFFPSFVMVIRDFNLLLTDTDENEITADQYLESALTLKGGKTASIHEYNMPRQLIRRYFKDRRCFVFKPPNSTKELSKGISVKNIEFENNVKDFTKHIYQCKPKRMTSGKHLNGRMFGSLVRSYVRFIQEGEPPCIHTAVKEMIEYENQNLVLVAQDVYKTEMQRLVGGALPEADTMAQYHLQCTDKAIEHLREIIIYSDVELFTGTALAAFEQVLDRLIKSVTKDSEKICWGRLQYLDARRIERKILNKTYRHASGYDEYIADVEWVIKQYNKTVGLGPKKSQILQGYLDGKEDEEKMVFQMVQEEQGDKVVQEPNPHVEVTAGSHLRNLPKQVDRESHFTESILDVIKEDQFKKKEMLRENLQHIGNEKNKEYERQVNEGYENAYSTEQENKRFSEIFLSSDEAASESAIGTLNIDKEKPTEKLAHNSGPRPEKPKPPCEIL